MTIIEMRRKRANLWEQAKAIHERAKEEKRDLSAEEAAGRLRLLSPVHYKHQSPTPPIG